MDILPIHDDHEKEAPPLQSLLSSRQRMLENLFSTESKDVFTVLLFIAWEIQPQETFEILRDYIFDHTKPITCRIESIHFLCQHLDNSVFSNEIRCFLLPQLQKNKDPQIRYAALVGIEKSSHAQMMAHYCKETALYDFEIKNRQKAIEIMGKYYGKNNFIPTFLFSQIHEEVLQENIIESITLFHSNLIQELLIALSLYSRTKIRLSAAKVLEKQKNKIAKDIQEAIIENILLFSSTKTELETILNILLDNLTFQKIVCIESIFPKVSQNHQITILLALIHSKYNQAHNLAADIINKYSYLEIFRSKLNNIEPSQQEDIEYSQEDFLHYFNTMESLTKEAFHSTNEFNKDKNTLHTPDKPPTHFF